MEYFLAIAFYSTFFLAISYFIWRQSPAESGFVVTGLRLLIAFLVFRCAITYLTYDTNIVARIKALNSLSIAFVALLASQFVIRKIYIAPGVRGLEIKDISGKRLLFLMGLIFIVAVALFQGIPAGFHFWDIMGSSEMSGLRREISKSYVFGSSEYRGQGIFRTIIELMGAVLFSYTAVAFFVGKSKLKKIFYGTMLLFVSLILISEGSRGMLMNAIVAAVCAFLYIKPKIRLGKIFISCFLVVAIFFASSFITSKSMALRDGAISFSEFSYVIFERLFMANAINDIYIFEMSDKGQIASGSMHWLFRDFKASIPGIQAGKPLAYELYYYKTGDLKGTTYLTGTHMMKAYMDGGYVSVFFHATSLQDKLVDSLLALTGIHPHIL